MAILTPALEVRLMIRPAATYAALTTATSSGFTPVLRRPVRLAMVLACFISFTTTGQLSIRMTVDGLVCWSFIPLLNLATVGVMASRFSRHDLAASIDGYLASFGPWLAWLLGIAGLAVWLPPGEGEVWAMWPSPIAFMALAIAQLWSSWIQYRCLVVLWRLPRLMALALLAAMKLVVWGTIVVFFFASDQLEPRLGPLFGG